MQNLTGVPSIWGDLNLAGQNMAQLSEAEQLNRKKKLLSAGNSNSFTDAISQMFGNRLSAAGTPKV